MNRSGVPEPKIEFAPKHYRCERALEPLVPDGRLNKPFWQNAPWTDDFVDIEGGCRPAPAKRTRVKMLWDDECFYVGAELEEDQIWATLEERDSVIFHDNDFEIFIDPDGDTHHYYEFEINALGTVWDLFLVKPYRDGGPPLNGWDIAGLKTAVHIDGELNKPGAANRRWSVEVAMPWRSLRECAPAARPPRPGEYWRINFSRVQWRAEEFEGAYRKVTDPATGRPYPEDNWVWSPQGLINMHYPELWGFVEFIDADPNAMAGAERDADVDATAGAGLDVCAAADAGARTPASREAAGGGAEPYRLPQDERIKWELRKLYYRQRNHYAANGCFCSDASLLMGGERWSCEPQIATTGVTFVASAKDATGNGTYYIREDGWIWKE